jgi:hypothetical protein
MHASHTAYSLFWHCGRWGARKPSTMLGIPGNSEHWSTLDHLDHWKPTPHQQQQFSTGAEEGDAVRFAFRKIDLFLYR